MEYKQNDRIFWLDIARILAILLVVFNHAYGFVYTEDIDESYSLPFIDTVFKSIIFLLSRLGVPLFLMITGTLMLNRDYEKPGAMKHFYEHNIFRLFIATQIWLLIYFILRLFFSKPGANIWDLGWHAILIRGALNQLFFRPLTFGNMWYMPMIICLYMLIPFVATTIKRLGIKWLIIPMALLFISGMILPTINDFQGALGFEVFDFKFSIQSDYLFSIYFLFVIVGFGIGRLNCMENLKASALAVIVSTIFIGSVTIMYFALDHNQLFKYGYSFFPLMIITPILFELIRRFANKLETFKTQISWLSKYAFALYMIHMPVCDAIGKVFDFQPENGIIGFFIIVIGGISLSLITIFFAAKIKWINRYWFLVK